MEKKDIYLYRRHFTIPVYGQLKGLVSPYWVTNPPNPVMVMCSDILRCLWTVRISFRLFAPSRPVNPGISPRPEGGRKNVSRDGHIRASAVVLFPLLRRIMGMIAGVSEGIWVDETAERCVLSPNIGLFLNCCRDSP